MGGCLAARGCGLNDDSKLRRLYRTRTFVTYRPSITNSFPSSIMSADPSTSTSNSNFLSIFNAALESYKRKTKKDLASHPLLPRLQSCNSPNSIITLLREQVSASSLPRNDDDGLIRWVTPTVNVMYAFSATIGQGVGLVSITLLSRGEYLL